MKKITKYFWNLLIALDQLANTILAGDPDETISSRAAKAARRKNAGAVFFVRYWIGLIKTIV